METDEIISAVELNAGMLHLTHVSMFGSVETSLGTHQGLLGAHTGGYEAL